MLRNEVTAGRIEAQHFRADNKRLIEANKRLTHEMNERLRHSRERHH